VQLLEGVRPEVRAAILSETDLVPYPAFLMLPFFHYVGSSQDAIYEILRHPATVSGLSDVVPTAG
jgi:hypothetical protein